MNNKFHKGEIELQQRFTGTDMAHKASRLISQKIIPGALPFIENQPFVVVSSKDNHGNIWSSILMGQSGWIYAGTEGQIQFELNKIQSPNSDIFFNNILSNPQVGMVVINLDTRRRYRINGKVAINNNRLDLTIEEAFPNCPKYIQSRIPVIKTPKNIFPQTSTGNLLNTEQQQWISKSDTFFVGSQSATGFLDVNHRGGNPGFIQILDNGDLKIPDYIGNNMYNTLGNLIQIPKAGLVFIDFEKNRVLQLTGTTSMLFDQYSEPDNQKTMDTGRYWLFRTEQWIQTNQHHNIDWELINNSPFNP